MPPRPEPSIRPPRGLRPRPSAWTMVAARSAAMGFNRLVDARFDALNPRTAMREIPRGAMSRVEATVFVVVATAAFVFAAWRLNPICLALSPVALAIVFWYSLAKRVTTYTQLFLGLAMAVAPVGGWLAVKSIMDKGPVITITFKTAEGLEANKTKIKFKDVDIGLVTQGNIAPDLSHVVATVEMVKGLQKS